MKKVYFYSVHRSLPSLVYKQLLKLAREREKSPIYPSGRFTRLRDCITCMHRPDGSIRYVLWYNVAGHNTHTVHYDIFKQKT